MLHYDLVKPSFGTNYVSNTSSKSIIENQYTATVERYKNDFTQCKRYLSTYTGRNKITAKELITLYD